SPQATRHAPDSGPGAICPLPPRRDTVGSVSNLRLGKAGGDLTLSWNASCSAHDTDWEAYAGARGCSAASVPRACSTAGATGATLTPSAGSRSYLVVPRDAWSE